ncbi:hypothetical protein K431DRAFT_281129 [Polychaeton citri CBS 116435]|uniref:GIY-YIG domain-containing protein n=1 Tax=Polychaeton citri CBS 116435 TaxID=1314669 RepID=A0A9P4QDC4_9PEZI|nr:hypothetical protein K431DRAFT_281129 [Polychaeton citri CBS 116435]
MTAKQPIPALYVCYLLRSTVRHQSLYVGSTPNPVRRLKQHNGDTKGGAVRTSRESLRPWEMACLVTGFPSKVAALQFEWAWQNTHLTRHISTDERLTHATTYSRFNRRTGKYRKKIARPTFSLTERLANLHLLLRSSSFERWPLKVTFYAKDVYNAWLKWVSEHAGILRDGIGVELDDAANGTALHARGRAGPSGIHALDTTYKGMKAQLLKTRELFTEDSAVDCAVCHQPLPRDGSMALVCNNGDCSTAAHLQCLSSRFIQDADAGDSVIPITGTCPTCRRELKWVDLVRELSLRTRGKATVDRVLKERKPRTKRSAIACTAQIIADANGGSDAELDGGDESDEDVEWHVLSDGSDDDVAPQAEAHPNAFGRHFLHLPGKDEVVPEIEDSDWDAAEMLE